MTQSQFRTLEFSMNNTLVAARQARVAASRRHDAAEEQCVCTGRRCLPTCPAEIAWRELTEASYKLAEREAAWRDYLNCLHG